MVAVFGGTHDNVANAVDGVLDLVSSMVCGPHLLVSFDCILPPFSHTTRGAIIVWNEGILYLYWNDVRRGAHKKAQQ